MSANIIIIGKRTMLNTKPESEDIIYKLLPHFSLDFNAFIAISLRKNCHVLDYRKSLPVCKSIHLGKR